MKFLLTILVSIAMVTSSLATDERSIDAKDAAQHVGETVVVSGTVVEAHDFKGGSIVLNFGAKYPNQIFVVFIPKNLVDVTGDMHQYVGKEMVVEGKIEMYKGKPEIKVDDVGWKNELPSCLMLLYKAGFP